MVIHMERISIKNLNLLSIIRYGPCSTISLCSLDNKEYCFKEILKEKERVFDNLV